ncbi:MAG: serine/threonine protein kinase [Xanthomonadales bacterium]|nr:serine/threonine protein kinase [Xanthomonadales bacterium]
MTSRAALALLEAALEHHGEARGAFVAQACAGDDALLDQVNALLAAHGSSQGFLEGDPSAPSRLGPWRLLQPIGRGGMGQVWLAERDAGDFQQQAAIKIVPDHLADADALRRAERERRLLARLEHPNIARVIDGGSAPDGAPWVAMEFIRGAAIDEWCRRKGLDLRARVRLFLQVLAAVAAAHRALVVHRDLKPSNVLVADDGTVKLLDFGIAASIGSGDAQDRTVTALAAMTPEYASPEQFRGEPLTTASDIHSAGLLLYLLVAGRPARESVGRSLDALARLLAAPAPTRPSSRLDPGSLSLTGAAAASWRRGLRGDLDGIVMKAIAEQPERRYGTAEAFADDLRRWLDHRPVQARGDGRWYRFGRFLRRNRVAAAASAVALVGVLGGLVASLDQAQRAEREAERARQANRFLIDMVSAADPHVSGTSLTLGEAVDKAVSGLGNRFAADPLLEGELRVALGRAYLSLDRLDDAAAQIAAAERLHRTAPPAVRARTLDAVALLAWYQGRYQDAEELLHSALASLPRRRDPVTEATLRNDLAALLNDLGRYEEALPQAQAALALASPGEGDLRAQALREGNLGYALHGLGRLDEAAAAYGRARALLESALPDGHPDRAVNLNNLALVLSDQGRVEDAIPLLEDSLAIRVSLFPPDHPAILVARANLAAHLGRAGHHDRARETIDAVLALSTGRVPPSSQIPGNLLAIAARVHADAGDAGRARALAEQALEAYGHAEAVEPGRREAMLALIGPVGR